MSKWVVTLTADPLDRGIKPWLQPGSVGLGWRPNGVGMRNHPYEADEGGTTMANRILRVTRTSVTCLSFISTTSVPNDCCNPSCQSPALVSHLQIRSHDLFSHTIVTSYTVHTGTTRMTTSSTRIW